MATISWQQGRDVPKHRSATRHGDRFWEEEKDNFGFRMMQQMGWSTGDGLGREKQGTKKYIRNSFKNDTLGVGVQKKAADNWVAHQGMFNDLLKRLNNQAEAGDASVWVADPVSKEKADSGKKMVTHANLEQYMARKRLYGKFRKATDPANANQVQMNEIFGKKDQAAAAAASGSEKPRTPLAPEDPLLQTSNLSIKDYFARKLAQNAPAGRAGGSRFQVASGSGFTLNQQQSIVDRLQSQAQRTRSGLGFGGGGGGGAGLGFSASSSMNSSTSSSSSMSGSSVSIPKMEADEDSESSSNDSDSPQESKKKKQKEKEKKKEKKAKKDEKKSKKRKKSKSDSDEDAEQEEEEPAAQKKSKKKQKKAGEKRRRAVSDSESGEDSEAERRKRKKEARSSKKQKLIVAVEEEEPEDVPPPSEVQKKDKKKKNDKKSKLEKDADKKAKKQKKAKKKSKSD